MKNKIICIVGATASGKTSLGIELAKKINAEIISADSMQIYRGLNIGTAKVTEEEAQGIKHHMIDICNVEDNFSVADFKNMCYDKIEEILSRGKKVIIVGGTGLYVSSVVYNMNFEEQEIDFEYRKELEKIAQNSPEELYKLLEQVDNDAAKQIHKNNIKRIIRALEIAKHSKILKSEHMENEKRRIINEEKKYDFFVFYLDWDREKLYDRINMRVDLMLDDGVLSEAKKMYNMKLDEKNTCMQAIGYKEFFPYFEGKNSLEECVDNLKKETRKYAKRQITWFKNKLEPIYINGQKSKEELTNEIINYIS